VQRNELIAEINDALDIDRNPLERLGPTLCRPDDALVAVVGLADVVGRVVRPLELRISLRSAPRV
jgi:hypothetical protein